MRMRLEGDIRPDATPVDIDQLFTWAQRVFTGSVVSQTQTAGDMSVSRTGPAKFVGVDPAQPKGGAWTAGSVETVAADPTWLGGAPGGLTHAEAAAAVTEQQNELRDSTPQPTLNIPPSGDTPAAPRRRGRRSTAQRAAEIAAETAASTAHETSDVIAETQAAAGNFAGALPPGIALPPGMPAAPPGALPSAPAAAAPSAAMPIAAPPAAGVPGAPMTLEDFKREALELHQAATGKSLAAAYPMTRIRATTWLDGSPKEWHTLNIDAVPPADRQRIVNECQEVLVRG